MELRFMKKITRQFKRPELTVAQLWDKSFCQALLKRGKAVYSSIQKLSDLKADFSRADSPVDFRNQLIIAAIQSQGGLQEIKVIIEELRTRKAFKRPEYYSKEYNRLKAIYEKAVFHQGESPYIRELDAKVEAVHFQ